MREMRCSAGRELLDEAILTRLQCGSRQRSRQPREPATTMVHRYARGVVPESAGCGDDLDGSAAQSAATIEAFCRFERFQITGAVQETWELVRAVNQYIVKREPWALAQEARSARCLHARPVPSADALRVTPR
jgi:hypothetical protein